MALPVVNETLTLANARAMARDATAFLLATSRRVGPNFRVGVGPISLTILSEPEALQQVLQRQFAAWGRGSSVDAIRPLLGNGLPLSDPPLWLTQRRTMQPSFHRAHGPEWVHAMREVAGHALDALAPGEALNTRRFMMHVARDVIVRAMFSQSLGDPRPFEEAFAEVERFLASILLPGRLPLWVPTPGHRRFKAANAFLHGRILSLIAERRVLPAPPMDLLTLLLQAKDPETGEGMSDAQLRDEVVNIFFAGHETTANLMTWTVLLLNRHPEARARAEAEVREVLAGRVPEPEELPRLKYLGCVLREALRLYPPAWLFARQAFEPTTVAGQAFAKGEVVLLLPYLTHRTEASWPEPDAFRPERFEAEASIDAATWKYRYVPFGAGGHVCIGNHFALMEATVMLAMLLQRGWLEATSPDTATPKMGATLYVGDGLPARFVPRAA